MRFTVEDVMSNFNVISQGFPCPCGRGGIAGYHSLPSGFLGLDVSTYSVLTDTPH